MRKLLSAFAFAAGVSLLATAAAASSAAAASTEQGARQAADPVTALVQWVNIPFETFTLENGLRVVVHTDR